MLAFWVYLREGVKNVVLEVGLGGEYDATNVIEKPAVTGITKLGLDHVAVLGHTIEEIAWHKAGIMKGGVECVSTEQVEKAREVLEKRAEERRVGLEFVGLLPEVEGVKLGLSGEFQKWNASLAVELCRKYLRKAGVEENLTTGVLPDPFKAGLEKTIWPGRCQTLHLPSKPTFYLDGAHTHDSVLVAGQWFASLLLSIPPTSPITLIFNQQERDAVALLRDLMSQLPKERRLKAVFCTNTTYKEGGYSPELLSLNTDASVVQSFAVQLAMKAAWDGEQMGGEAVVKGNIEEAIEEVGGEGSVFVCGSLHLVGGVLEVLGVDV